MKLSVIGLGRLGSPMAAVMAHKGHTVVGVDVNPLSVEAIQHGRAPVKEPGLAEMIHANRTRLTATLIMKRPSVPPTSPSSWSPPRPNRMARLRSSMC